MFEEGSIRNIESIQFGLFNPEEIKRGSVVNVLYPETMESSVPKENGLIDLRMGTTERGFLCQTCGSSSYECVGHYGHIELVKPMFHVGYISKIKKTLECVCFYCSKIKISKERLKSGLNNCWDILKNKMICEGETGENGGTGCQNKQPVIKKEGLNLIVYMKGDDVDGKVILNGEKVFMILKAISEEDQIFLGFDSQFCRPEWMLLTVLLVPPPSMRPSIVMNGFLRGEDDLTHKLADIVKANGHLRKYEQEGAPGHIIRDYEQLLQFHLATFIDNDIGGQPQSLQKNGRPLKSITARLKGKEGRLRGNLMGKRVDFSARTVITPEPNISCEEVGVPVDIARIHTFPEKVTRFNREWLTKLVATGPNGYPGANYVVRNDGQRIDLNFSRQQVRLETGYIVERHMISGDRVLFNRQPSLHKMSMMGHRARVMEGKTFRVNLSVTKPYNADFDGDEMNLHMPQSYNTSSELANLTDVSHQIISPQSNAPIIGIVQDTLNGCRLFTRKDIFLRRNEAMNLLYSVNTFIGDIRKYFKPTIIYPVELWTGKQIFSGILPNVCYKRGDIVKKKGNEFKIDKTNAINFFNDSLVLVLHGHLISGVIDKKFVGAQPLGIIQTIYNDINAITAREFIDNVQKLINHYLTYISSFSIGIGDCVADTITLELCQESIKQAIKEVDIVILSAKKGELERQPGMSLEESLESRVNVILNRTRDISGTAAHKSLNDMNNMKAMVISGAKGSYINISQCTTCLGQQNVEGKRIPFGFCDRSLPHFIKHDYSARSRGFVKSSYLYGLHPSEFFFHAMGGREGLIDTAIKTAETGYIQRRLVKAMESATVQHDYSVRTEDDSILQYSYGDDAFDAAHLEHVTIALDNFTERYFIDNFINTEYSIHSGTISNDVYQLLTEDIDLQKLLDREYEYLLLNKDLLPNGIYVSPVNIDRILLSVKNSRKNYNSNNSNNISTISPYLILELLDSLMGNNLLLNYYIRISLAVKRILPLCSIDDFREVVARIRAHIDRALVNPNEMVGTLAAQSVGEPATQMTLNTFHLAGVASKVTMGVPRLNEIINVTRTIKTPLMKVYLTEDIKDIMSAKQIQSKLEYCIMKHICRKIQIIYDPDVYNTVISEDKSIVLAYFEFPDDDIDHNKLSPLVIRVEIERSALIRRGLTLDEVALKIRFGFKNQCHIITSDENDENPRLRIRFKNYNQIINNLNNNSSNINNYIQDTHKFNTSLDLYSFYLNSQYDLLKLYLQGVSGINKAYISNNPLDKDLFCLQTDGINFRQLLSYPGVDYKRLLSNNFIVVYEHLGIEAARQSILNELKLIIEDNGSYVNYRHLSLLADVMASRGFLTGITRHGINKSQAGALKKASFEETVDIFLDAAVNHIRDSSHGITESIMLGQLAPLGTGNVELHLDMKKLGQLYCTDKPSSSILVSGQFTPTSDSASLQWSPQIYSETPDDSFSGVFSPLYCTNYSSTINNSNHNYSPTSPSYSINSPGYSPQSTQFLSNRNNPVSPSYSPVSPSYSPVSPSYSPVSPSYSPVSPSYSPVSPSYSPVSPSYSPVSPSYSPISPSYSPISPSYSPVSPSYSPVSPSYIENTKITHTSTNNSLNSNTSNKKDTDNNHQKEYPK